MTLQLNNIVIFRQVRVNLFTDREKSIMAITNAVTVYATLMKDENTIPQNKSIIQFILDNLPEELKKNISIEIIEEVLNYVTSIRNNYV